MYAGLLHGHNFWRWVIVVAFVVVLVRALRARSGSTELGPKAALPLMITVDVQLLIGLVLWFVSPVVAAGDQHYYAYMHPLMMLIAVVGAHLIHRKVKNGASPGFLAASTAGLLVWIAAGVPWWRPLFPGMGG